MCVQEQEWGEGRQTKAASLFHVQGSHITLYHRASEQHKDSFCIQGNRLFSFLSFVKNENKKNLFILKLLRTLQEQRNLLCLPGLRAWKNYAVISNYFFVAFLVSEFFQLALHRSFQKKIIVVPFLSSLSDWQDIEVDGVIPIFSTAMKNQPLVLRNSMFFLAPPWENKFMILQSCSKHL